MLSMWRDLTVRCSHPHNNIDTQIQIGYPVHTPDYIFQKLDQHMQFQL